MALLRATRGILSVLDLSLISLRELYRLLQTGTGALTADYPAAMAFETDAGLTNYVVYNYSDESITVTFSDGTVVVADPNAFALEQM